MQPKVSFVIPAYNEEKDIGKLLDSLMALDYPKNKYEVIIVDDGSTDRTVEIASKYPIKIIKGPHKGVGVARNLGWRSAKFDIIVFIDADMILHKNFLKEIIKCFKDPKVAGADCTIRLRNKKSLIARVLFLRKELGVAQYKFPFVKICKKKVLKEVGGFDPQYGFYDDWVLNMRILEKGYKILFMPKAIIWHREPENLKEVYRQARWMGRSLLLSFKGYRLEALRRFLFVSLCAFLPIYVLSLFLPFPFNLLGFIGLFVFTVIEFWRSYKMFLLSKQKESFLTPLIDFVYMWFVYMGMIDGLIHIRSLPRA